MAIKRYTSVISIFAISAFFIASNGWAGKIVDNFEKGKIEGWEVIGGTWKVKNKALYGEEPAATEGAVLMGDETWKDYSIECKVRDVKGPWIAILLRWQDINNHYTWWIETGAKRGRWYIKQNGTYVSTTNDPIPLDLTKEFTFKATAKGDTFEGYFNGKLINVYKDNTFKSGPGGLVVWESSATFDDVLIEGPDVPVLSVNPKDKIATIWGKVKSDITKTF